MEQVKGVSYSLNEFLGPAYWQHGGPHVQLANPTATEYEKSLLTNKDTDLFHCVIYLAPGQLHFFSLDGAQYIFARVFIIPSKTNHR